MALAFIFPGQGSQAVGMGRALADSFPTARQVFEEVDEALSQHLSRLMFEGPESELTLTENAQPALMAVSLAALRILESEAGWHLPEKALCVAGHSLGEYSALAAIGALGLQETAKLLRLRGRSMQQAVPVGEGAMAALLGLDLAEAESISAAAAKETGCVCSAANDNAPGQVVISGAKEAIEVAVRIAAERGAKRSVLLPVSAPFHSALMQPAADRMAEALARAEILSLPIPIVSNVTASFIREAEMVRALLVKQITAMVRWRESIQHMKSMGVDRVVEIGSGKVLSGLVKRIDRDIAAFNFAVPDDLDPLLKAIG